MEQFIPRNKKPVKSRNNSLGTFNKIINFANKNKIKKYSSLVYNNQ